MFTDNIIQSTMFQVCTGKSIGLHTLYIALMPVPFDSIFPHLFQFLICVVVHIYYNTQLFAELMVQSTYAFAQVIIATAPIIQLFRFFFFYII